MAVQAGKDLLIKIDQTGNGQFETIPGLRATRISFNGETGDVTSLEWQGGWRELLSGAGVRHISVSGAGIFTGSDAENAVRGHALAGTLADYELSFESGARMQGRFLVSRLDYAGDYNGERSYTLALESSGPVVQL